MNASIAGLTFPPGHDQPLWTPESENGPSPLDRLRQRLILGNSILDLKTPPALVEGLLQQDSLALVYGPSGSGKTFVGLDLTLHLAHSAEWHGREVQGGPVLYVIAESPYSLAPRVRSWLTHHHLQTTGPVHWLPFAPNLLDRDDVALLIELASELDPVLIIIDTLARCMVGGDENSAKDMGLAVDALARLQHATESCVLPFHHTGKDPSAGARGSSALQAALDTEIEVRKSGDGFRLDVTKQRSGPDGTVGRFRLEPIGDSCVVAPLGDTVSDDPSWAIPMLESLDALDVGGGVSNGKWATATQLADRTFQRHVKPLLVLGLTANVGSPARPLYRLTPKGADTLRRHTAP
jgi:AAA domain